MVKTDGSYRLPRLALGAGLGLWNVYLTVAWLTSAHPWGSDLPGCFAAFFLWTGYSDWTSFGSYGSRQGCALEIFGAVAAASIATLWIVASSTDGDVYRDQARDISVWVGMLVGVGMVILWVHPTTRRRMLAAKRGQVP